MYRAIVGIGALCALLIVGVYQATAERIRDNQQRFLAGAVARVLPSASRTLQVSASASGQLQEVTDDQELPVFLGFAANDDLVGAVVTAEGMGYQDTIRVLYAYDFELQAITGMQVLDSKETPGLGDKVEKEPHFLANFERLDATVSSDGARLENPIITVKQGEKSEPWQIDGITGATITSEAIGSILNVSARTWVPLLRREAPALINRGTGRE